MKIIWALTIFILFFCEGMYCVSATEMTDQLDYPEYWLEQGVSQYSLNHYDRALTLIETALQQDPGLASAWMWRGTVLAKLGRALESDESYAKAKELDPLIMDPYRKKVGSLADIQITPLPTARPGTEESNLKKMVESDIDISKKPDPEGPDMVLYDLQVSRLPDSDRLSVNVTIGNEGVRPTLNFFVTFYGSYQTPVSSSDSPIGFYLVPNLLPGEKTTIEGFFPIAQIPSGNYYIGAYIDPNNEIREITKDNNGKTASVKVDIPEVDSSMGSQLGNAQLAVRKTTAVEKMEVPRADLVIDLISGPMSAMPGDAIPVTTTIRNAGNADAGLFRLAMFLSRDTSVSSDDIMLGYGDVPDLAAGKAREGTATAVIPDKVVPGTYYLVAMADSQNAVTENDKQNNQKAQDTPILIRPQQPVSEEPGIGDSTETAVSPSPSPTPGPEESIEPAEVQEIALASLPDLIPLDIIAETSAKPGTVTNVSTVIKNNGPGDAGAFNVSLFISPDTVIRETEDLLVGMGRVENLPAGKQRNGNASVPIPSTIKPGKYYIGLFVDSSGELNETNEDNNYGSSITPTIITS